MILEVSAAMAVRTTATAAAALAAAAAVLSLYSMACRERRLRQLQQALVRERVSHRLVAGRLVHDVDALRCRLDGLLVQQAVVSAAALVLDEALAREDHSSIPPMEGGPR